YGARRLFIVGAALFGIGSLVASEATSVTSLLIGEAVIEGIGASLMMPATLAILSNTFDGHERAKAFAIWGATAGAAVASGPVLTLVALVLLGAFVALERAKWRAAADPLFELSQLRFLGFRYGLLTTAVLAMGQLGFLFVLPVLLQEGQHLSAVETGVWLVPS